MGKDINKAEKELLIAIALGNRSLLTLIVDHCDSAIRNVPGSHAMVAQLSGIRKKIEHLDPIEDPIRKREMPYMDLERWW